MTLSKSKYFIATAISSSKRHKHCHICVYYVNHMYAIHCMAYIEIVNEKSKQKLSQEPFHKTASAA